ncbi:MAG: TraU family protein, partial [Steroidobacteraceae bacterium]|nr:TraU family protein [Steroidobacteraceae bacterium]
MRRAMFALLLSLGAAPVGAEVGCQNAEVIGGKLITDICWDCLFPIRLAGITMKAGGEAPPDEAVKGAACVCPDDLGVPHPGITQAMW